MQGLWVKRLVVFGAVFAGICAIIGLYLALLFELQGFGTPRDLGPRPLYVTTYIAGIIASFLIPLILWHTLLGMKNFRLFIGILAAITAIGVISLMGLK